VEAHLLAVAVDVLNALVWTTRALNMKNPGKPPEPLPRPGEAVRAEPSRGPGIVPGLPVYDLRKKVSDGNG
jgi:hypothetical protein